MIIIIFYLGGDQNNYGEYCMTLLKRRVKAAVTITTKSETHPLRVGPKVAILYAWKSEPHHPPPLSNAEIIRLIHSLALGLYQCKQVTHKILFGGE